MKEETITFEDTDEVFKIMAKDDRFIIGVRSYTTKEREQEIEKYSNGLNELLDEEYRCDNRGYETFNEFYEYCLEVEEFEQQYKYDNGDCPETISKDTFCYTLIDLKENIRGADNYYCKFDYDKQEECEKALIELNNGDMQLSRRNKVELKIKEIK